MFYIRYHDFFVRIISYLRIFVITWQAMKVIQLLQNLAKKGNTVVFSIHQPRASIYALFDDITLLSEGRVIFTGPVSDMVSETLDTDF